MTTNGNGNGRARRSTKPVTLDYQAVIIGAGFGGIAAGIELDRAGIHDFLIIEKWHDFGGTWLANTYPGVACDIPAFAYSYSFEQRSDWSRFYAPGKDFQRYAKDVATKYGLVGRTRFHTALVGAEFDEASDVWRLTTDTGDTIVTRFLVPALGGLERPKLPEIEGLDSFAGKLMHTAMWDHDYDLMGKRVAVIGTGATALQLIPEIQPLVEHMTVYQRTAIYLAPKVDFPIGALGRFILGRRTVRAAVRAATSVGIDAVLSATVLLQRQIPLLIRGGEAASRVWLRTQVADPVLREKLTPDYALGCKRPSMSNTYLKAFTKPNVDLITEPIARITEKGIVTADGNEVEVDLLVCATGFSVMDKNTPPYPCLGRNGVNLSEFWDQNRFQAYEGVSVPGFPNMFMIIGPYSFLPGNYFWTIEGTSKHAARAIKETLKRGATACEIRQEPHDQYFEKCVNRLSKTHLYSQNCAASNTYYINYQGDAAAVRPSLYAEMWWAHRHFPLDNYRYTTADQRPVRKKIVAAKPAAVKN